MAVSSTKRKPWWQWHRELRAPLLVRATEGHVELKGLRQGAEPEGRTAKPLLA